MKALCPGILSTMLALAVSLFEQDRVAAWPAAGSTVQSDPLWDLLARRGYAEVPVDWKNILRPLVVGKIGEVELLLLVDTAANAAALDQSLVESLKLPTRKDENRPHASFNSSGTGTVTATIGMLRLGRIAIPNCMADVREIKTKNERFVGILGDGILAPNQALFDLVGGKLYLRGPVQNREDGLADDLGRYFRTGKYVEIPTTKPKDGVPYAKCRIGEHELTLIVDTGAQNSMLDASVANRIGVKFPSAPALGPHGVTPGKPVIGVLPAAIRFPGDLELPAPDFIMVDDFTTLNNGLEKQGLPRTDGLLGVNVLRYFSAVIDYSAREPRLFLIDPYVRERRLLDQTWIGVGGESEGKAIPSDQANAYTLVIDKNRFELTGPNGRLDLRIDEYWPNPDLRTIDLVSKGKGKPSTYLGIYEISYGQLRICMPLRVDPGQEVERPKSFSTSPGSPYSILTFRRQTRK